MSQKVDASHQFAGFVFKGQLAESALAELMRPSLLPGEVTPEVIAEKVSLHELDPDAVSAAGKMAPVYVAIASFENTVRRLISDRLLEQKGPTWWEGCVPDPIKKQARVRREGEVRERWHGARGDEPICFTELGDLSSIIQHNWDCFSDLLPSSEWVRALLKGLERSRNVIMHSGQLAVTDIERVGVSIRDWARQVGT